MVAPALRRSRRRESGRMAAAAVAYAAMGWPVCVGAHPPGRTRAARAGPAPATGSAARPRRAPDVAGLADPGHRRSGRRLGSGGLDHPEANVILPTGRVFDVLDVPAAAGLAALDDDGAAGVRPGPVALGGGPHPVLRGDPRRSRRRGRVVVLPPGLRARGRGARLASLRWHCRNSYVLAPPSRYGAGAGRAAAAAREQGGRPLPDAVRLLEFLADACDEDGQMSGAGRSGEPVQPGQRRHRRAG